MPLARNLNETQIPSSRTTRYGIGSDSCMSYDSELDFAVRAADAAGAILREAFHDSRVSGHFAGHSAEQQILGILSAGFPAYGYRGEQLGRVRAFHWSTLLCWRRRVVPGQRSPIGSDCAGARGSIQVVRSESS